MGVLDRLKHAWNSFVGEENRSPIRDFNLGYSSSFRPDRPRFSNGSEKSIVIAKYNRMAIDCASVPIKHVKLDPEGRYLEDYDSELNKCLTVEANKDQQSRAFLQEVVLSLFDEGCIAVVPIDTNINIEEGRFDILSMRTAKIIQWFPDHVQVEAYNDRRGIRERITFPKKSVAIIENPYYSVMNEKNSVAQRLIRKLNILDVIDEQSGSGKLDLIIQLPYVIKTDARRNQAEKRRLDMENQLASSKYGIAYTDGTEKITQLNRSVENNLLKQIEYLTSMLNGQLGINEKILDGSASEEEMLNYMNRTIEPILAAITSEFNRKFLTKTARTQGQTIKYFNDPFRLVTVSKTADMGEKFTRNEIMSSNEVRQILGLKPVKDPKADELRNKNLNEPEGQPNVEAKKEVVKNDPIKPDSKDGDNQNG